MLVLVINKLEASYFVTKNGCLTELEEPLGGRNGQEEITLADVLFYVAVLSEFPLPDEQPCIEVPLFPSKKAMGSDWNFQKHQASDDTCEFDSTSERITKVCCSV
ncbi:uncharacterized protein LOC129754801 [Uranotaenia lowii]|uniref:uncharacterized protein LOC129754801 n=1 Tax=Uranotaenia lowii TaxID=190385 RepID=UPI00247863D8|nr:uncharacterized protein LOC129754801 [Uranotaenia lowii]